MRGSKGNSLTSLPFFFSSYFSFSPTWREEPPRPRVHRHVLDGGVGSSRIRRGTAVAMDICMRPINGG